MEIGNCIYCKLWKPLTDEHVMPASLGGNLKKALVYEECRRATNVDPALADQSWITLARAAYTPETRTVKATSGNFHFDAQSGFHIETFYTNRLKAPPLPQLHLRGDASSGDFRLFAENQAAVERLCSFISKQVEKGTLRSLHVKIGPLEYCKHPRLVLYRRDTAFVRVPTDGLQEAFFAAIERNLSGIMAMPSKAAGSNRTIVQPKIESQLSISFEDMCRALAKIAFSVLAVHYPGEILHEYYDVVRDFILTGKYPRTAQGEDDDSFNTGPVSIDPPAQYFKPGLMNGHTVGFLSDGSSVLCEIVLYGACRFFVLLAQLRLGAPFIFVHDFSNDATQNSARSDYEAMARMYSLEEQRRPMRSTPDEAPE